jgi:hypothetical protein
MSIISLQEIMIVVLAAAVITAYHAHLYIQVRRDPLKTAIGITNHARQMWVNGVIRYYNHAGFMINTFEQNDVTVSGESVTKVINHAALHYTIGMRGFYLSVPLALWLFGPIWMLAGSLVLIGVLYRLDREA